MIDFKIGYTFGLLRKTLPFVGFRLLVYLSVVAAYLFGAGAGAGIGYGFGQAGDDPHGTAVLGTFIGVGFVGMFMYWIREYILYLVKAGHIAVLVELMDGRQLPNGKGQINYAQEKVRERFAESSILFGIDQLVKGVLKAISGAFMTISAFIPIPGLEVVTGFINRVVRLSLTYVDEVILAHNMRTRAENPWASSRDALVLYGQNYKTMLKNALFLTFILWAFALVLYLIVLAPSAAIVAMFPGNFSGWGFVVALVLAWGLKKALLDPFAMTALMQVYFKVTEGQKPDAEWDARLTQLSGKFKKLKDRAAGYVKPQPAPATAKAE